jgi:hypothetical protein
MEGGETKFISCLIDEKLLWIWQYMKSYTVVIRPYTIPLRPYMVNYGPYTVPYFSRKHAVYDRHEYGRESPTWITAKIRHVYGPYLPVYGRKGAVLTPHTVVYGPYTITVINHLGRYGTGTCYYNFLGELLKLVF